jgi:putative copper export protein
MNWAHLHVALNHIPVLGTLLVFALFCAAMLRRSDELKKVCLGAFVVLALVSVLIKFTGDYAFQSVAKADWIEESVVTAHDDAANQATTGMIVLGLLAASGLFLLRTVKSLPRWLMGTLFVAAFVAFLLMARAANLGGRIRHTEIRPQSGTTSTNPSSVIPGRDGVLK